MSDAKTLPEKAKALRLDFGRDDTPLREVFGTNRITLSEMQSRLWTHIESKHILVVGGRKTGNASNRMFELLRSRKKRCVYLAISVQGTRGNGRLRRMWTLPDSDR